MRGFPQVAEARGRALPIEKIDADVTVAWGSVGRATGYAHDRPVILLEQPPDDVAPDDPERSDDDGLLALCHGTLPVARDRPALFTVHARELIQTDASLKGCG